MAPADGAAPGFPRVAIAVDASQEFRGRRSEPSDPHRATPRMTGPILKGFRGAMSTREIACLRRDAQSAACKNSRLFTMGRDREGLEPAQHNVVVECRVAVEQA